MTPAEQAAKAIKDATGLPSRARLYGAEGHGNAAVVIVEATNDSRWRCQIRMVAGCYWDGTGSTPEAAIADVLPRYRAHIAALAADILPGWPRLEWQRKPGWRWSEWALLLVVGGVGCPLLTVGPYRQSSGWWLTYAADPRACVTSGTREKISAAVAAHVESLALPCPLPPFPGASDAS